MLGVLTAATRDPASASRGAAEEAPQTSARAEVTTPGGPVGTLGSERAPHQLPTTTGPAAAERSKIGSRRDGTCRSRTVTDGDRHLENTEVRRITTQARSSREVHQVEEVEGSDGPSDVYWREDGAYLSFRDRPDRSCTTKEIGCN